MKEVDAFTSIEDILRIPLNLMELHCKGKGIAGHELIAGFDNIRILKPTGKAQYEGFQILMSGSGCRNYENLLAMNQKTFLDLTEACFERSDKQRKPANLAARGLRCCYSYLKE